MGLHPEAIIGVMLQIVELSQKTINTFYFKRNSDGKVVSQDISSLDAAASDPSISEWGGISGFSSRVTDVISRYLAE